MVPHNPRKEIEAAAEVAPYLYCPGNVLAVEEPSGREVVSPTMCYELLVGSTTSG